MNNIETAPQFFEGMTIEEYNLVVPYHIYHCYTQRKVRGDNTKEI